MVIKKQSCLIICFLNLDTELRGHGQIFDILPDGLPILKAPPPMMGVRPLGQIPPAEDKSSQTWFDGEGEDSDLYVSSAERYRNLVCSFKVI